MKANTRKWPPSSYTGVIALGSGKLTGEDGLFVPELFKTSAITKKMYSFYISSTNSGSYIDFGKPDANIVGAEPYEKVTFIDIDKTNDYWSN